MFMLALQDSNSAAAANASILKYKLWLQYTVLYVLHPILSFNFRT